MKLKLLTGVLLILIQLIAYAQEGTTKSDSIRYLLEKSSPEKRLKHLLKLSFFETGEYSKIQESYNYSEEAKKLANSLKDEISYVQALILQGVAMGSLGMQKEGLDSLRKSLELAIDIDNDSLIGESYTYIGLELHKNDQYKEAIDNHIKGLEYFKTLSDTTKIGYAYNNLGNSYFLSGDLVNALQYYNNALGLKLIGSDKDQIATAYNNLALVYKDLQNYDKSLLYNKKSIAIQQTKKDTFSLSFSYLNVGNIYRKLAKYDSSIIYHSLALEMSEALSDTIGIGYAYYNLGSVNYDKTNYSKSIEYYAKALDIFERSNSRSLIMSTKSSLSTVYQKLRKTNEATDYALEALAISKELGRTSTYTSLLESLFELYKMRGDYKTALEYHEQFYIYSDSLLNQQKLDKIAELETNFEISQRDNAIELLNKANELNELKLAQAERNKIIYILIGALLLIIIIIVYRSYNLKKVAEKQLAQKNENLEELNSAKDKFFAIIAHDLRSPLSAFKSLSTGLSENFKKLSKDDTQRYLNNLRTSSEELVGLLQNLLQWALSQTNTLKHDKQNIDLNRIITKNIDLLEQNASQKNIQLKVKLSNKNEVYADEPTLDLVFRNLISNAIKFTNDGGFVTVETMKKNDNLSIYVKDTGIGMTSEDIQKLFKITEDTSGIGESPEKGTGLGLILCKEFIDKNGGKIFVKSEQGMGSTFEVVLPLPNQNEAA